MPIPERRILALGLFAEDLLHQGDECGTENAGNPTTHPTARNAGRLENELQLRMSHENSQRARPRSRKWGDLPIASKPLISRSFSVGRVLAHDGFGPSRRIIALAWHLRRTAIIASTTRRETEIDFERIE